MEWECKHPKIGTCKRCGHNVLSDKLETRHFKIIKGFVNKTYNCNYCIPKNECKTPEAVYQSDIDQYHRKEIEKSVQQIGVFKETKKELYLNKAIKRLEVILRCLNK